MATFILIEGEPGMGKSTSIRTLDPENTVIVKPNNKPLPFKGGKSSYNPEKKNVFIIKEFTALKQCLLNINEKGVHVKNIVIEDLTHFFTQKEMADRNINGFQKWADMAYECYQAIVELESLMRDDLFVYILAHTTSEELSGGIVKVKLQTVGKMLDNKVKIPSYFTYVLHAMASKKGDVLEYYFLTQNDGVFEAKSPMDCLELKEPNDLKLIRTKIEDYQ